MLRSGRTLVTTLLALLAGIGALAVASPAAQASGTFCSNNVCITSHDDGEYLGGLEVGVWQRSDPGWTRVHVWSSDGSYNVWTGGQQGSYLRTLVEWVFPRRSFRSGTRVCAEGWKDGRSVGLPCFTIRA
jgi:hypothetical protein